jgi:hypothetical protein
MSKSWDGTNAEHERIKNRARKREEKRQARAEQNPLAFGWEKTEEGTYQCLAEDCEHEPFSTLAGCLEHMHTHSLSEGQTGLGDWA